MFKDAAVETRWRRFIGAAIQQFVAISRVKPYLIVQSHNHHDAWQFFCGPVLGFSSDQDLSRSVSSDIRPNEPGFVKIGPFLSMLDYSEIAHTQGEGQETIGYHPRPGQKLNQGRCVVGE